MARDNNKRVSAQLHDSRTEIGKFRPETGAKFSRPDSGNS